MSIVHHTKDLVNMLFNEDEDDDETDEEDECPKCGYELDECECVIRIEEDEDDGA